MELTVSGITVPLEHTEKEVFDRAVKISGVSKNNINISLENNIPSETVRMAMAIVVAGPALVIFPFFQKYFVKGMTVGSIKG